MPAASNSTSVAWGSLLEPAEADDARRTVIEIARNLRADPPSNRSSMGADLANGAAGEALLFGILAAAGAGGDNWRAAATERIEYSFDRVGELDMDIGLLSGIAGVAWAAQHLSRIGAIELDPGALDDIDQLLVDSVAGRAFASDPPFDIGTGLVGIGIYGLERWSTALGRELVHRIIDRLAASSVRVDDGIGWRTPAVRLFDDDHKRRWPEGRFDFGLAHGVPCVLAMLALAHRRGVDTERCRALASGIKTLLDRVHCADPTAGRYPAFWTADSELRAHRLAWCYGELGVAAALCLTGDAFGRSDWRAEGTALARSAAARTPDDVATMDPYLCHGAFGVAHVFARIAVTTGEIDLARAARGWFRRGLAFRRDGAGWAGFAPDPTMDELADRRRGLFLGVTGIGLALWSAVTDVEPGWDRLLLLS